MKTIVMGKKIKNFYELKSERDDDGKFISKPYVNKLVPEIKWEEICSYDGEAQFSYDFFSIRKINISEDEEVAVVRQVFRADLGNYIQYTDKVLEEIDNNLVDCEEKLIVELQNYNTQKINDNPKAKKYCDLHNLNYAETDYEDLMEIIGSESCLNTEKYSRSSYRQKYWVQLCGKTN